MRRLFVLLLLCSAMPALAGTPRFAYVPNIDDGTISQFVVNANTGQLLPDGYAMAGEHPRSFVQVGPFAYVANMNGNSISAFSVDPANGTLQPLPIPAYSAPGNPYALIASPNGKFLYAVASAKDVVYAYSVNGDGSLSAIADAATGAGPRFLAITGNGSFLYIANHDSNNVSAYRVDATTGKLILVGIYSSGGLKPTNVMTSNRFLYLTNAGSNNVSAFTINFVSGALSQVAGSPFPTGNSPSSLAREYNGHFIYIGNSLSNNISAFAVNANTGALSAIAGSPFAATKGTQALKVDPSNHFLYAADAGAEEVLVFRMDLATGGLTETSSIRTHGIGFDVYVSNGPTVSRQPFVAYMMNNDNNYGDPLALAPYGINPNTGALTALPITRYIGGAYAMGADATGRLIYLFGGHGYPLEIILCQMMPDGTCPEYPGFIYSDEAFGADDPQGVYHYMSWSDYNSYPPVYQGIFGYRFDFPGGIFRSTLVSGPTFPPTNAKPVGFDLSGKFMYDDARHVFSVNPRSGALTFRSTGLLDYAPTLHPSGHFLYLVTPTGVRAEAINPVNGTLTTLSSSLTSGGTPLIEQSGQFAYLHDGKKITLFRINLTTGALTKLSSSVTTTADVHIDATRNFLYLLKLGTMDDSGNSLTPTIITTYKINHMTGALTHTATLSFPTESVRGYTLATTGTLH